MADIKAKRYIEVSEAMDRNTLYDWYILSIDETISPIWTDEHIEELSNDFYLVHKDTPFADVEEVKHGSWKGLKPDNRGYTEKFQCSECKCITTLYLYQQECDYEYCPNCGAKMDLKE